MNANRKLGALEDAMHTMLTCGAVTFAVAAVGAILAGICGAFTLADGVLTRLARPELLAGAF